MDTTPVFAVNLSFGTGAPRCTRPWAWLVPGKGRLMGSIEQAVHPYPAHSEGRDGVTKSTTQELTLPCFVYRWSLTSSVSLSGYPEPGVTVITPRSMMRRCGGYQVLYVTHTAIHILLKAGKIAHPACRACQLSAPPDPLTRGDLTRYGCSQIGEGHPCLSWVWYEKIISGICPWGQTSRGGGEGRQDVFRHAGK